MPGILLFADDAVRIVSRTYQNGGQTDPNDDFSSYGPGKSFIRSDKRMRPNGLTNDWGALRSQNYAFFGGVPQISFASARAQRGEVLPSIISSSIGIASYPALSAVMRPVSRFLLPFVPEAAVPVLASLLAIEVAYGFGKAAAQSVRWFKSFGYRQRRIEQGGDYQDTETAFNLRLGAVRDMSSAMSYSRRWLGREAEYMR